MNQIARQAQAVQADARLKFTELRKVVDNYQISRSLTDNAALGVVPNLKRLSPTDVAKRVRELRDAPAMERAVSELYDLLAVLYGRDPTEDELRAGPPDGSALANFPSIQDLGKMEAVAHGAWTLTALFTYLWTLEGRIQQELGIDTPTTARHRRRIGWAGTAVGLAVLAGGGYYAWRKLSGGGTETEDSDEGEDEDEVEVEVGVDLDPEPEPEPTQTPEPDSEPPEEEEES